MDLSKYSLKKDKEEQKPAPSEDVLGSKTKTALKLGNLPPEKEKELKAGGNADSNLPGLTNEPLDQALGKREEREDDTPEDDSPLNEVTRFRKIVSSTKNKRLSKLHELDKKLYTLYSATDFDVSLTTTISLDEDRHKFIAETSSYLGVNIKELTFLIIDSFRRRHEGRITDMHIVELQQKKANT